MLVICAQARFRPNHQRLEAKYALDEKVPTYDDDAPENHLIKQMSKFKL